MRAASREGRGAVSAGGNDETPLVITAVLGSPNPRGNSAALVDLTLAGAVAVRGRRAAAFEARRVLPEDGEVAGAALAAADAVVIAAPTYRETYPGTLKTFLDTLPRGARGEDAAPLAGKPVGVILTGASPHHFLATNSLHGLLSGGFAAFVVPVSIYAHHGQFDSEGLVRDLELSARAELLGRTLARVAELFRAAPELHELRPQI